MNNPFDYTPDAACADAFRELIDRIEALKHSPSPDDVDFCRELEAGKMLGVLIAADSDGARHTLYAFSGQIGSAGFHHRGFVGPAFDYLRPDGYFKTKEAEISRLNIEIAQFENGPLARARNAYEREKENLEAEVSEYRELCRLSKLERNARRMSGRTTPEEMAAMIRHSQFEKAELHRLKKRSVAMLEPFAAALQEARSQLDALKEK
ncbi:MAG: RluA family pseudouridine synthase, partial [Muribaculaceae bacterium]|nr:RluA family pseudouridine synthase [Muribaculaceae bacterium]